MDRLYTKRDSKNNLKLPEHKETRCYYCNELPSRIKYKYYSGGLMDISHDVCTFLFKCHRCNHSFCEEHRLPEQHDCIGLPQNIAKLNKMVNSILTDNEREMKIRR